MRYRSSVSVSPWNVSGSGRPDLAEQDELRHGDGRLAAPCLRRRPCHSDDVAEVDVDLAGARCVAQKLDPRAAVDEVEEDELPHAAAPEHTAGDAHGLAGLGSRLERLGTGPHRLDRDSAGKPLRSHA